MCPKGKFIGGEDGFLTDKENRIRESVALVAKPWAKSPYYERAEQFTSVFWAKNSVFRGLFDRLQLASVVELACGHGRHAAQIVDQCGELTLLDVFQENLDICRKRLAGKPDVNFVLGNGYSFEPLPKNSVSSIYCYDAMVHFSPDIVESYLEDAARALQPHGMALFHHSNYDAPDDRHYGLNPHARNSMTQALFASYCKRFNLGVEESIKISWGKIPELDCVTLCRKLAR